MFAIYKIIDKLITAKISLKIMKINEQQLYSLIKESVKNILAEAAQDENFGQWLKGMGSGVKGTLSGMKSGFQNGQLMNMTNTQNRSQYDTKDPYSNQFRDYSDLKDATVDVKKLYALAKEYRTKSNQLYARAQAMEKYANLEKTGKGTEAQFKYRDSYGQGGSSQQVAAMSNRRQAGQNRYRNI